MPHGVSVYELPGIGRRFDIALDRPNERISVVMRGSGSRDLYVFATNSQEPTAVFELTDDQARKLAAVLAGMYYA